ncbi:hypothetical protein BGZ73_008935 [Actinomortierella ambigua]|nr:hypothetical protein BGZ73_008935 [Actinomortierella ambigua]
MTPDFTPLTAVVPEAPREEAIEEEAEMNEADVEDDEDDYEEGDEEVSLGSLYPTVRDESLLSFSMTPHTETRASAGQKNRTKYSEADLEVLNEFFARETHPDQVMRQKLADKLGKKEEQIKTWFMRRRSAVSQSQKVAEARSERSSSNSPNPSNNARGGSPSSPRQTHARSSAVNGRPSSREASPLSSAAKMSASEITKHLSPLLRGGSIAREDDVPQVIVLIRAAHDEGGRRFLLNVLKFNRNPNIARRFVQSNVMDAFKEMLMESRRMQNALCDGTPSQVLSPSLLLLIIDVLTHLPVDAKHVNDTPLSREVAQLSKHKNSDVSAKAKVLSESWEKKVRGRYGYSGRDDGLGNDGLGNDGRSGRQFKKPRSSRDDDDDERLIEQNSSMLPSFKKKPTPSDTVTKSAATVNTGFFSELMAPATTKSPASSAPSGNAATRSAKSLSNSSTSTTAKSHSTEPSSSSRASNNNTDNSRSSTAAKRKEYPDLQIDSQVTKKKTPQLSSPSSPSNSPTSVRQARAAFDLSAPPPVSSMEEARTMIEQRRLLRAQRGGEESNSTAATASSSESTMGESVGTVKIEIDLSEELAPLSPSTGTTASSLPSSPASTPRSILRKTPRDAQAAPKGVKFHFGAALLQVREFDKDFPVTFKDGDELPMYDDDEDDDEDEDDEDSGEGDGGEGYGDGEGYHYQVPSQYHWMAGGGHPSEPPGHRHGSSSVMEPPSSFVFGNEAVQIMLRGELWYTPAPIGGLELMTICQERGAESQEKYTQEEREASTLSASNFDPEHMPDSPEEPEPEEVVVTTPLRPIALYAIEHEDPDTSTALLHHLLSQLASQNQSQQQQQQQQQQALQHQLQMSGLYGFPQPAVDPYHQQQQQQQQQYGGMGGVHTTMDAYGQWPSSATGVAYSNQQQQLQDAEQRISDLLGMLPNLRNV